MRFSRRHVIAYLALAAVVVAVGVRYLLLDDAEPGSGEQLVLAPASSPPSPVASSGAGGGGTAPKVVVHVCGAVRSPGLIRLPQGARIADALEAAGGATAKADLAAVNLAAKVGDGQQIVVPDRTATSAAGVASASGSAGSAGSASSGTSGALVNINTASAAELESLPGVGPSTAQKIVDYRSANGGFQSLDDLKNVPGIGDAKFAAVKDAITI